MKVTIITASYNSAATINQTLQSVQDQKYEDIEHIIIDGESKDQTLDIVKKYSHIKIVVSEKDSGIYDAMNKGISLASGDIIGILNSDDFYTDDNVINEVTKYFISDPSLECIYADLFYVDQKNTSKIIRKWRSGKYNERSFYYGWMPPHPTFFVRKEIYAKYGTFNSSLKTAADYELMLRFLQKHQCKCAYLPKTIIKMRVGGASNQNFIARLKANKEDKMAWSINHLTPYFYTLWLKPLRKIVQYFI